MSDDRRTLFATADVAHVSLRDHVDRPSYAEATRQHVACPVLDLCAAPLGSRDRQLLWGQEVDVLVREGTWSFVRSVRDGYVGWVASPFLGGALTPTHRVVAPATHLYPAPDFKRAEAHWLSVGSLLRITDADAQWAETIEGFYVPAQHIAPVHHIPDDWVAAAEALIGVPYLWGGNSSAGIDCSGLVQLACDAASIPCPGDSDQQAAAFTALDDDAPHRRGDLHFWAGHVAIATDDATLVHANVHAMATCLERRDAAMARIPDAYLGRRRVPD